MPPAKVLCLTTGGSLDKTYDGVSSSFIVGAPTAKRCLRNVQCAHVVEYAEIYRKDSLELTKGDGEVLDAAVRAAPQQYIVITHGTDTLNVTAKALQRTAVATGKTVVLTGAMKPYAFMESDGPFNLGAAFTVVTLLPPGCHVVFHGRVFGSRPYCEGCEERSTGREGGEINPRRAGGHLRLLRGGQAVQVRCEVPRPALRGGR